MHSATHVAVAVALTGAFSAMAQQKQPPTVYWMNVETRNTTIPGMEGAGMMGGAMGRAMGMGGPQRTLTLQLGSPRGAPGAPEAEHLIPPGQSMGPSLPLVAPERTPGASTREERQERERQEPPKARLLIYWGCGDTVGAGQPRVVDTARMNPADFGRALAGRTGTHQAPPAAGSWKSYVDWPNRKDPNREVPPDSSLVGDHAIKGNFPPEMRFSLDARRDFMAPVVFRDVSGGTEGAIRFAWNAIPTAIGYFATAMASRDNGNETILWSASEVPDPGWGLMDYLTPADVQRFIREKVVLSPSQTNCTIPAGIFKGTEGAFVQFIGYGEELNVGQPPRPADPVWAVKVRLKSTGTLMVGSDERASRRPAGRSSRPAATETPDAGSTAPDRGATPPAPASPGQEILDGARKLRGIFGF